MRRAKQTRLERAGLTVGTADQFLELSRLVRSLLALGKTRREVGDLLAS